MLFKNLLKRQQPARVPATPAKARTSPATQPAQVVENAMPERRCFPRPLPVPEVHEQDWAAWEDLTQEKTSDKPV